MIVKDIIKITKGKLLFGNEDEKCENFTRDSREVKNGDVYIALKGEKFDGNSFYKNAIDNGAKVCIVSEDVEKYKDSTIIKVDDTLKAMQDIATFKRSLYDIPVVAVTGSVGKTSTKDLIASVVSQKYNTLKTKGNYNNDIGLPLTILSLKDEEAMVVEMGMNHFGEIRKLTNIAKPTIAVITNIGTAHIGNLGSRENILKAKLEILEGLQGNTVVVNNDNDLLNKWAKENSNKYNIITYGINCESEYMAKDIMAFEDKSEYTVVKTSGKDSNINGKKIIVPVGGEHFILNSLCAIAVGECLNVEPEKIVEGVAKLELSKKRMEIIQSKCGAIIINDTYNANYDSMTAAITYLKSIDDRRKIAVLGDMLELGEYSKALHENVGKEIDNKIDILITIGNEARYIDEMAKPKKKLHFDNNEDAEKELKKIMQSNDAVLLKASNGMKFFEIANIIKEF